MILDFVGIVSAITKLDNNKNFKNKIVKDFITSYNFKIRDAFLGVLVIELVAIYSNKKKMLQKSILGFKEEIDFKKITLELCP